MTRPSGGGPERTTHGASAVERRIMSARLAAMAAPRGDDTPRVAALRAVLRDETLMAHVTANVEWWPPLTEEQREALAELLARSDRAWRQAR